MLTLIEQTSERAIFEERRTNLRIAATICLAVSLFALFAVVYQWRSAAEAFPERVAEARVVIGTGAFAAVIFIFAAVSVYVLLLSRKMTLTLDRERGDITLIAPRGLRRVTETVPYFGVKSVRLTGDDEMRVIALVFVLRDGRVVPITAAPVHARGELEALAAQLRDALFGT